MITSSDNGEDLVDLFTKRRSTLITDILLVNGVTGDIFFDETGIIRHAGPDIGIDLKSTAEIKIDGSGTLAMPGLVNSHTHAAMSLLRGYADDMHLQQWLSEKIWPLEAHLTGDDVYWGTRLACIEMIRSGTVAFNDMYFFMEQAADAVDVSGMRALLSHGLITFGDDDKFEKEMRATRALVSYVNSMKNTRINAAVGPHALYTVPPNHLEWCAEFSKEEAVPIHIHLSETKKEVDDCLKTYQVSPAVLLDQAGCLTPHTIAAHGCYLNESECRLVAERGAHVAHNPVSNMKLSTGRAMPYHWLKTAGANVALATDGCSSNNNLDMFEEMKVAAICQKFFWNLDTLLPAEEALDMATCSGAAALGLPSGRIAVGKPADIVLISRYHPSMVPMHNPVSNLVYAANGGLVRTVFCDGKLLMYDGVIPGEDEVLKKSATVALSLVERAKAG